MNVKRQMVFHKNSKRKHLADTIAVIFSFKNACKVLKFYATCIQIIHSIFLHKSVKYIIVGTSILF